MEMYGAMKKGMRNLSPMPRAPKCPTSHLEAYNVESEVCYIFVWAASIRQE